MSIKKEDSDFVVFNSIQPGWELVVHSILKLPNHAPYLFPSSNQISTSLQSFLNSRSILSMAAVKRSMASDGTPFGDDNLKKIKVGIEDEQPEITPDVEIDHHRTGFVNLDENLLYEILKHVDARSLAMSACVSKLWNRTALDERLWELICTRHSAQVGCSTQQLRSVVLALGGFRRLHSLYLWPLTKPPSPSTSASSSSSIPLPRQTTAFSVKPPPKNSNTRYGKDEVQLSLSLLSIRYFEKMNYPVKDN